MLDRSGLLCYVLVMANTEVEVYELEVVEGVVVTALADGAVLTYIRSHEAWWAAANKIFDPELSVMAEFSGDGCDWEFSVKQCDLSGVCIKLGIFSDSFAAFRDIPEFFRLLTEENPVTVDQVCGILDRMGASDRTDRVNPYAAKQLCDGGS